ncbi:MAG: glycosyltransferase family 2 protein [Chloroflexi bacterium]|nr:glycosyltransferase family 2 protein [Chloroflexota bacterium]
MTTPFVSVIIVNYNGAHFLTDCLNALHAQTYPNQCFEVIVSDNGSTDGSLELLQTSYPWVKVIDNQCNLGFASGNNVGIKQAQGQYVVLLNNDTAPTAQWLASLVTLAENNPEAGIITGHLQLFYDQLELVIESETIIPINDGRTLGIQVFGVDTGAQRGVVQHLDGFYGREFFEGQYFRWTKGRAILGVPLPHNKNLQRIQFCLAASRPINSPVHAQVLLGDEVLAQWELLGSSPTLYTVELPESKRALATPLVQNAGSVIFSSGAGRDRGTFVRGAEVFYEVDKHQYDRVEEVFAACGANMLIRRALLDDVGLFDDDFFMYYEDTDLSWQARLRGWKILYAPKAIVRHIHCGSSIEWSPSFVYHADRNRLAMLFKNAEIREIVIAWCKYLGRTLKNTFDNLILSLQGKVNWKSQMKTQSIQYRVMGKLILWLPKLYRKRRVIQSRRRVSADAIQKWFVE